MKTERIEKAVKDVGDILAVLVQESVKDTEPQPDHTELLREAREHVKYELCNGRCPTPPLSPDEFLAKLDAAIRAEKPSE